MMPEGGQRCDVSIGEGRGGEGRHQRSPRTDIEPLLCADQCTTELDVVGNIQLVLAFDVGERAWLVWIEYPVRIDVQPYRGFVDVGIADRSTERREVFFDDSRVQERFRLRPVHLDQRRHGGVTIDRLAAIVQVVTGVRLEVDPIAGLIAPQQFTWMRQRISRCDK